MRLENRYCSRCHDSHPFEKVGDVLVARTRPCNHVLHTGGVRARPERPQDVVGRPQAGPGTQLGLWGPLAS